MDNIEKNKNINMAIFYVLDAFSDIEIRGRHYNMSDCLITETDSEIINFENTISNFLSRLNELNYLNISTEIAEFNIVPALSNYRHEVLNTDHSYDIIISEILEIQDRLFGVNIDLNIFNRINEEFDILNNINNKNILYNK